VSNQYEGTSRHAAMAVMEELRMSGTDLAGQLREFLKSGRARRVTVLSEHGDELFSLSLTPGAVAGARA
jgi:Domain of unknown function (DUF4342)